MVEFGQGLGQEGLSPGARLLLGVLVMGAVGDNEGQRTLDEFRLDAVATLGEVDGALIFDLVRDDKREPEAVRGLARMLRNAHQFPRIPSVLELAMLVAGGDETAAQALACEARDELLGNRYEGYGVKPMQALATAAFAVLMSPAPAETEV